MLASLFQKGGLKSRNSSRQGKRKIMGISILTFQPNSKKALETQSDVMLHAPEVSFDRTDATALFEGYASD